MASVTVSESVMPFMLVQVAPPVVCQLLVLTGIVRLLQTFEETFAKSAVKSAWKNPPVPEANCITALVGVVAG